jgi:hypothetical protein
LGYLDWAAGSLKTYLKLLDRDLWRMEPTSQGSFSFDLSQLVSNIIEAPRNAFSGKRTGAKICSTLLTQFQMFNEQVRALAEGFVLQLWDDIINLNKGVSTEIKGDKPLLDQITEIRNALARLREAKEAALLVKNNLESNGSTREARVRIGEL